MIVYHDQETTGDLFSAKLITTLDKSHPLALLAAALCWKALEASLAVFYSHKSGRPCLPLRLMIGLQLLKYIYDLSDERVIEQWRENVYFQAFTGRVYFSSDYPCDPSELSLFRKRIGKEGCEIIFAESVRIHGKSALEKEVIGDTTVQEKYTKYPTDMGLILDSIKLCIRIAKFMKIKFRRTYAKEIQKIKNRVNFSKGKLGSKQKNRAVSRLRTIANKILRELQGKLPEDAMGNAEAKQFFETATKAVNQKRNDKGKIYSLFEPQVNCIAKGKPHKKFEFGNKVSLVIGKVNGVILGVSSFPNNPYDGDTIKPALEQLPKIHDGYLPDVFIGDKGYRGRPSVLGVSVVTPSTPNNKNLDPVALDENRKRNRRRSSIEPVIGHVKHDHRLLRNELNGVIGDEINPILAAAAFNFKKHAGKVFDALIRPFKNAAKKTTKALSKLHGLPFRRENKATATKSLFDNPATCPEACPTS
jgi:IS5 family transposase